MADERIQEGVPEGTLSPAAPNDVLAADTEIFCPRCFRPTDSLKDYDIPIVYCLLFFTMWTHERVIACPSCMRNAIGKRTLVSIVLTNGLFPFVAIFYLYQFLITLSAGHTSLLVANAYRRPPEERFGDVQQAITRWTWPANIKAIVLLVVAFAIGFLVLALCLPWGRR